MSVVIAIRCQWCNGMTLGEQVGHQLVVAVKGRPPTTYCHGQAALTCDRCKKVTIWEGDARGAPTFRQMEAPER